MNFQDKAGKETKYVVTTTHPHFFLSWSIEKNFFQVDWNPQIVHKMLPDVIEIIKKSEFRESLTIRLNCCEL